MELNNFIFDNYKVVNFVNATENQTKQVLNLRNKGSIRKWMFNQDIISEKEHKKFIKKLVSDLKNFYWSVFTENNELLGVVYLNNVNFNHFHAYLGIYANIDINISGKGNILMKILKKIAFTDLQLHTLKLEVFSENEQAIKFYKEQNFKLEGEMKEFVFINNHWFDVLIFGMTNPNS